MSDYVETGPDALPIDSIGQLIEHIERGTMLASVDFSAFNIE